jgi:hypothetical protein
LGVLTLPECFDDEGEAEEGEEQAADLGLMAEYDRTLLS